MHDVRTGPIDQPTLPTRPGESWRPERCDRIALVLQGGGALGACQAGVYQAMHEAGVEPDWVSGVSIGAINSAIIAGNAPKHRLRRLREFWDLITERKIWPFTPDGDIFPQGAQRAQLLCHQRFWPAGLFRAALPESLDEPDRRDDGDQLL
jgi:NTE family protein